MMFSIWLITLKFPLNNLYFEIGLKQTVNHQNGWLRNTHVPHTENGGQQEKPRYVAS